MNFGVILCFAFVACWSLMQSAHTEVLVQLSRTNGVLQLLLFLAVAVVPFLRTRRVSWVDIAWPFGVAVIGIVVFAIGDGYPLRRSMVAAAYLFIGLRMGIGAVAMARATGVIFRTEFPRYRYRRLMLEQSGSRHVDAHLLAEIMTQGFANLSVLALPGFLMAIDPHEGLRAVELAGFAVCVFGYGFESVADLQKLRFISRNRGAVCDVGLWRFTRHPNYFGEWLVWTGLVIAAIPSWMALRVVEPLSIWIGLGIGTLAASAMLYTTLVYLTGAKPAEYFSERKREGYRAYQARTPIFFPRLPKAR